MKTAISLPDELFSEVELLVRASGRSRSEVYSQALREYVARHAPDGITDAVDRVVAQVQVEATEREFSAAAAAQVLRSTEW